MDARALLSEIVKKSQASCSGDALLAEIDGWDSLKGVRLVLRLQEVIGRELSEADIVGLQRVSDIERLLRPAS